jgi:hypothetical protein
MLHIFVKSYNISKSQFKLSFYCYDLDSGVAEGSTPVVLQTEEYDNSDIDNSCVNGNNSGCSQREQLPKATMHHVITVSNTDILKGDIGQLITTTTATSEIVQVVKNLSPEQKYHFLKNHVVPSQHFIFPTQYCGGHHRSFQRSWLDQYKWLVYSIRLDGAFCIYCVLFETTPQRLSLGTLVNRPFVKWSQKSEILNEHQTLIIEFKSTFSATGPSLEALWKQSCTVVGSALLCVATLNHQLVTKPWRVLAIQVTSCHY